MEPALPNRSDLEAALLDALPGLELLDRGLVLDGLATDAVGVDAEGRLNLVLFTDGLVEGLPLRVLDTLRLAKRQRFLLGRHLAEARLDVEVPARVVVVAEAFDAVVAERLACLPADQVRCYEVHEMRSAKGNSTLLQPAGSLPERELPSLQESDFLQSLETRERERVADLTQRIERIDREVAMASGPGGLEWRYRGTPLCRLRGEEEGLVGSVVEGPSFPLLAGRDVEGFLDAALRRYLQLLDSFESEQEAALSAR